MEAAFRESGFRKLTGPIEHWLTTFHTNYWGFRSDKREAWEDIEEGEIFLFHASSSKFLDVAPKRVKDAGRGVIGIGRVGATSVKSEPAWWEEIHHQGEYPYLVHFSEIHWFGDTDEIRDVPVSEKSVEEMVRDVHALGENKITFGEMDERAGYRIPAQGSPGNVKYPEKLFPLLVERIHDVELDGGTTGTTADEESMRAAAAVRTRDRDRNLEASGHDDGVVVHESSINQTMEGWIGHEHSLDVFEDELIDAGFETGETEHSDILAWRDSNAVLGEAKSIHESNEREQIRTALGQLYEYSYFDVEQSTERDWETLTKCLLLTREPSTEYRPFLEHLEGDVFTFWTDEYELRGLPESMARFDAITS